MYSTRSDRRLVIIIVLSVVVLFGGVLALALSSSPRDTTRASARVDREPARVVIPAQPAARPDAKSTPTVPPVIDTGPTEAVAKPAPTSGATVTLDGVVGEPWGKAAPAAAEATPAAAALTDTPKPVKVVATKAAASTSKTKAATGDLEVASPSDPVVVPEVKPRVEIVEAAIALGVEDRVPQGVGELFSTEADKVWAWVKVKNAGAPTTITMVWRKGEEVAWQLSLDVGSSSGWRTWSRKTVRKWDVGEWTVDIFDANGLRVHTLDFEVAAPEALPVEAS